MSFLLGRFSEPLYCLMRLVLGLLYASHGAQKLGVFGGHAMTGRPLMLAASIIELVGGLLIAFGLLARIAAFISAGEMAVAYFTVHAKGGFWPILNKGELAVVFCFAFLFIASYGPGRYSLDRALRGRRAAAH